MLPEDLVEISISVAELEFSTFQSGTGINLGALFLAAAEFPSSRSVSSRRSSVTEASAFRLMVIYRVRSCSVSVFQLWSRVPQLEKCASY